jgi:hypothetical protein
MSEANKSIVRAVVEEGYNSNNLSIIEETHAQNFVVRWLFARTEEDRGPQAAAAIISALRDALPDLHVTIDNMIAEGDLVALHWTIDGTHRATTPLEGPDRSHQQESTSGFRASTCCVSPTTRLLSRRSRLTD